MYIYIYIYSIQFKKKEFVSNSYLVPLKLSPKTWKGRTED